MGGKTISEDAKPIYAYSESVSEHGKYDYGGRKSISEGRKSILEPC
jgi:hypothetical protein